MDSLEDNVWLCGECGVTFPGTSVGMMQLKDHCMSSHQKKPGECSLGVATPSGDMLISGWGAGVLQKAWREGKLEAPEEWTEKQRVRKERKENPPQEEQDDLDPTPNIIDIKSKKPVKRSQGQVARIVMRDVDLDPALYPIFYEAQSIWPELYPDSSSPSMADFIRDFVICTATFLEMSAFNQTLKQTLIEIQNDGGITNG